MSSVAEDFKEEERLSENKLKKIEEHVEELRMIVPQIQTSLVKIDTSLEKFSNKFEEVSEKVHRQEINLITYSQQNKIFAEEKISKQEARLIRNEETVKLVKRIGIVILGIAGSLAVLFFKEVLGG